MGICVVNGNILKWWPVLVALVVTAAAWGANNQKINTHVEEPAHKKMYELYIGQKAATDRIDERTSRMLERDEKQGKDIREIRQMIQRFLERTSQ